MTGPDLKAWRARLGMTQAVAAALFGIPLPTWKRWERKGPWYPELVRAACEGHELAGGYRG